MTIFFQKLLRLLQKQEIITISSRAWVNLNLEMQDLREQIIKKTPTPGIEPGSSA